MNEFKKRSDGESDKLPTSTETGESPALVPPWQRVRQTRSHQQEQSFVKQRPQARAQVNSGRIWSSLRDVTLNSFLGRILIDNKDTEGTSYTIKEDDWEALKRDANRTPPGCHPALQIDIRDTHLFVVELAVWDELVEFVLLLEAERDSARDSQAE